MMSPTPEEIDRWGLNAMPAFVEEDRGNTVFRAAGGFNYRNSSVTVFDPDLEDFDTLLPRVLSFCERQKIEPVLRILGDGGSLGKALEAGGWAPFRDCLVMTKAGSAEGEKPDAQAIEDWPLADWLDLQVRHKGLTDENKRLFLEIFSRVPERARPVVMAEPGPPASALLHLEGEWTGLMNMLVDPKLRGHGLGRRFLEALLSVPTQGFWLQVFAKNTAAVRLYETSGFTIFYRYRYWRAKESLLRLSH